MGRDERRDDLLRIVAISIHAPRVGRDRASLLGRSRSVNFNPRAPCGARLDDLNFLCLFHDFNPRAPCGARPTTPAGPLICASFQSTRPVWGATRSAARTPCPRRYFNPRAPCGARHALTSCPQHGSVISIHAPRVGRDNAKPVRFVYWGISIHAPRVGRDLYSLRIAITPIHFNPRAPCGARPLMPL